jgi:hypothetical protein
VELLRNGSYEWDEAWIYPQTPARARRTQDVARSGSWSAFLGLRGDSADVFSFSTVHQRIAVPAEAEDLQVSFWYWGGTEEEGAPGAEMVRWDGYAPQVSAPQMPFPPLDQSLTSARLWSSQDWQRAIILDGDYQVEEILLTRCEDADSWQYFSAELDGYAGRDIVLYFEVFNAGGSSGRTWMYVDDVSVAIPGDWLATLPLILCGNAGAPSQLAKD